MAYRALYRKYRPDNFDGVVGQKAIIKTLQNIVREGKISHAYLFSGPRGTGKTSTAKLFAKAINCLNPKDGIPCGECGICKQFANEQNSDIIEIDAASNNGVDEIRDLKSKINLAPTSCKYKVYIIDEVHMLSIGAFNALLKTLEEPPHHVVFILATTEMQKLPLTIISRCQNYNFKKITEDQMKLRLNYIATQEKINISEEALYEIARISDGGMRDAIGLLEQLYSYTDNNITLGDVELLSSSVSRKDIANLINNIYDNSVEEVSKLIEYFYQEGKDFIKIAEDIVILLKDAILYKKAEKYFKTNCTYKLEEYLSLYNKLDENKIYRYIDELNKAIIDIKISSHPKIVFEITLLKLIDNYDCSKSKDISNNANEDNILKNDEKGETNSKLEVQNRKLVDDIVKDTIEKENVTTPQPSAKIEKTSEEKISNISDQEDTFLPSIKVPLYKKILINNTLAEADKKLLAEMSKKCEQLSTFLINKDFKTAATILLDGKIVGVSNKNLIYSFQYDAIVDKADEMLNEIEVLIEKVSGRKFKIINIDDENWQLIRPYYVKLIRAKNKIEVLPEVDSSKSGSPTKNKKNSKEIDDAINMFGEELIEIK